MAVPNYETVEAPVPSFRMFEWAIPQPTLGKPVSEGGIQGWSGWDAKAPRDSRMNSATRRSMVPAFAISALELAMSVAAGRLATRSTKRWTGWTVEAPEGQRGCRCPASLARVCRDAVEPVGHHGGHLSLALTDELHLNSTHTPMHTAREEF